MLNVDTLEAIPKEPQTTEAYNNLNEVHSTDDGLTHCWRIAFREDHPGGVKNFRIQTENREVAEALEGLEEVTWGHNFFMVIFAVTTKGIDVALSRCKLPPRLNGQR